MAKYGSKTNDDAKHRDEKINRAKSDMTVKVIQYNHLNEDILLKIADAIGKMKAMSEGFGNQRELLARSRMNERVLNSALKMLSNNKLQLWMINDSELGEGIR